MAIIHIDIHPNDISLSMSLSIHRPDRDSAADTARTIILDAPFKYTGTYPRTRFTFLADGKPFSPPMRVVAALRPTENTEVTAVDVVLVPEYDDPELEHRESAHICIDVSLDREMFDDLWRTLSSKHGACLTAVASFKAPETDLMGREVIWDIDKVGNYDHPIKGEAFSVRLRFPNGATHDDCET